MCRFGISFRIAIVGWTLLGLASAAAAQTVVGSGEFAPLRSAWEQRVLRGHSRVNSGDVWAPVDSASMTLQAGSITDSDGHLLQGAEMVPDESLIGSEMIHGGGHCATCGVGPGQPASAGCGGCETGCATGCGPVDCCPQPWIHHFSLFLGVQGFKGPADQGIQGNFGFNEGINWSAPLSRGGTFGYQVGFRAVQSNFEGDQLTGPEASSTREQMFLTAGLFRRSPCSGWQGGIVYDYLRDSYYYGRIDLGQIRAELAWSHSHCWDVGFWGAFGMKDHLFDDEEEPLLVTPTDLYAIFFRRHFACNGNLRLWAGFTGQSDGLVGADVVVPLGRSCALESGFNYLVPNEADPLESQMEESWALSMRLVWYPGRDVRGELESPFHSMFTVADNGVFMTDFR